MASYAPWNRRSGEDDIRCVLRAGGVGGDGEDPVGDVWTVFEISVSMILLISNYLYV